MCTHFFFYERGERCLAVLHSPTTSPHPQMTVTQHGTKANTRHHLGSGTHPGTTSQPACLAESRNTSGAGLRKARTSTSSTSGPRGNARTKSQVASDEGLSTVASGTIFSRTINENKSSCNRKRLHRTPTFQDTAVQLNPGVDESCVTALSLRARDSIMFSTVVVQELFWRVASRNCASRPSSDIAITRKA